MARPTASGVQGFVLRQNGMAQDGGADDTKALERKSSKLSDQEIQSMKVQPQATSIQGKSQANTRTARDIDGPGRMNPRSQSGMRSAPKGMLSTDASNAVRTSASGSTQNAKQGKEKKPPVQVEPLADEVAGDGSSVSESGSETDEDEDDDGLQQPSVNQAGIQTRNAHVPHVLTERRMTGDSYPATTSGVPSEVDVHDAQQQTQNHARGMQVPTGIMPVRGSGPRGGMTAPNVAVPRLDTLDQASRPAHVNITSEIGAGFQFGVAPAIQPKVNRLVHHGPQPMPHPQRNPLAQNYPPQGPGQQHRIVNQHLPQAPANAQRASANTQAVPKLPASENQVLVLPSNKPVIHQESHRPLGDVNHQDALPHPLHFTQMPAHERNVHKSHTSTVNPQPPSSDVPQPSGHQYSEFEYLNVGDGQDYGHMDEQYPEEQHAEDQPPEEQYSEEQHHPEERQDIDYAESELFSKSYADIKAQSFDLDPCAVPLNLPQELPTDNLHQKLVSVMKLKTQPQQPNPQFELFKSMTLTEWEEAGDWFLDRFSDLMAKLKAARKQKRKIAHDFECEIEQRHEAVAKKQKMTQAALDEMKMTGGKVLEGTPKKSPRKSTKAKK